MCEKMQFHIGKESVACSCVIADTDSAECVTVADTLLWSVNYLACLECRRNAHSNYVISESLFRKLSWPISTYSLVFCYRN